MVFARLVQCTARLFGPRRADSGRDESKFRVFFALVVALLPLASLIFNGAVLRRPYFEKIQ